MDDLIFDTRYTGVGFDYESSEFPAGNVVAALAWAERHGVAGLVRSVCQPGAVATLRSRRSWATRADAERAMARFLNVLQHVKVKEWQLTYWDTDDGRAYFLGRARGRVH